MQSLITSAHKSKTELTMVKNAEIPFYVPPPSMNIQGTQHQIVTPYINITGPAMGQSVVIKAPSGAGFMTNMSLQYLTTYTINASDEETAPVAFNMTRSLEILSGGNLIVFRTGKALLSNFLSMKKSAFQKYSMRHAKMLEPGNENLASSGDAVFVTYLPFDECFLDEKERFLLLNAIDLQFRITFEDCPKAGLFNATYSVITKAFIDTYVPTLDIFNKIVYKDWTTMKSLEFTNTQTEPASLTSVTTGKMTIQASVLASQTDIFVQRINPVAGGGGSAAGYGCPLVNIKTVTIVLNGVPFYQDWPVSRVNELGARNGNESADLVPDTVVGQQSSVSYNAQGILSINWGILANKFENSGVCAWENLQGTTVEITFDSVLDTSLYLMYAIHHTFNIVDYVPSEAGAGYLMISAVN